MAKVVSAHSHGVVLFDPARQRFARENQLDSWYVDTLPSHSHTNQLLKRAAKETEESVIKKYAGIPCAIATTVLQEISSNMLSSSFPGQLSSASTAGRIRMKV